MGQVRPILDRQHFSDWHLQVYGVNSNYCAVDGWGDVSIGNSSVGNGAGATPGKTMKTKLRNINNSVYKLVIDEPMKEADQKAILATVSHFEGTGCWAIEDVRLSKYGKPGPYFCVGGDQYWASYDAKTSQEADFVRSLLRDFKETPLTPRPGTSGAITDGASFHWCTFNGLVPGRTSNDLSGYPLNLVNGAPLFHTRKDALAHLKSIAVFWDEYPESAADDDIIQKAGTVKIDNPARQLSEMDLLFRVARLVCEAIPRGPTVEALNSTPCVGHLPSKELVAAPRIRRPR